MQIDVVVAKRNLTVILQIRILDCDTLIWSVCIVTWASSLPQFG